MLEVVDDRVRGRRSSWRLPQACVHLAEERELFLDDPIRHDANHREYRVGAPRYSAAVDRGRAPRHCLPMRRRSMLLLATAWAGCRHADVYPAEVVNNFMTECTTRSDAGVCRCALDALERRVTLPPFLAFSAPLRPRAGPKEGGGAGAGPPGRFGPPPPPDR